MSIVKGELDTEKIATPISVTFFYKCRLTHCIASLKRTDKVHKLFTNMTGKE